MSDSELFKSKMSQYTKLIDDDINQYAKQISELTEVKFGVHSQIASDAYFDILARGGKRIRGILTIIGYQMCGGNDQKMIIEAARAIEMLHAYILIIDDIQDRSPLRRGGPSAHMMLADYHRKSKFQGDAEHFGVSIALNAALTGAHAAGNILANINADEMLRINALSIVNRTMITTAHGQTHDIINEVSGEVSKDLEDVLEWKTAHYSFLNPLHVGMVLAGAGCESTDAITEYAMNLGRAFQILDDIAGTFGTEKISGKDPRDDTREGKRTILSVYALEHSTGADKQLLLSCLGNQKLTIEEFDKYKTIIEKSGAYANARTQATDLVSMALTSLDAHKSLWDQNSVDLLAALANAFLKH